MAIFGARKFLLILEFSAQRIAPVNNSLVLKCINRQSLLLIFVAIYL